MKFLVMRKEIIKSERREASIHSSCFPIEVEWFGAPNKPFMDHAAIVAKALDTFREGYRGNYEYVVVPMTNARVVSFRKPRPVYETFVEVYC